MRHTSRWVGSVAWTVVLAGAAGVSSGAGSVTDLGIDIDPRISADGRVVAGTAAGGSWTPYRWTAATGLEVVPLFGGYDQAIATAINGDGSVIVGRASASSTGAGEAFKWTATGGMGGLGGTYAFSVTADGQTVVGRTSTQGAVTWSANGTMSPIPGFTPGVANGGVSADGSVIAGSSGNYPAYWTQQIGAVPLPLLPDGAYGEAKAVSGDGSTIVGYDATPHYLVPPGVETFDTLAFRWTANKGLEPLGHLAEKSPGHSDTTALCVNGDGTIIGGYDGAGGAFVWDEVHGMRSLSAVLESAGIGVQGWSFGMVSGISADGMNLVGSGLHNGISTSFLVEVPASVWVPEPGGAALVLGTAAMTLVRRRR